MAHTINVYIDPYSARELKAKAGNTGISVSGYVAKLIYLDLDRNKKFKPRNRFSSYNRKEQIDYKTLFNRYKDILEYINSFQKQNGFAPSIKDIGKIRNCSKQNINRVINLLELNGLLKVDKDGIFISFYFLSQETLNLLNGETVNVKESIENSEE